MSIESIDDATGEESEENLTLEDVATLNALGAPPLGGTLLRAHVEESGGESRPQQQKMAEAICEALVDDENLLVQAGTGTGKSFAYLFPLAASDKRAVIATATNQLSEQLVSHDLPAVAETMRSINQPFSYSLLKGRANYVCLAKLRDIERLGAAAGEDPDTEPLFADEEWASARSDKSAKVLSREAQETVDVVAWAKQTSTGDRTEAPAVSETVWGQISATSSECPGARQCPFGEECYTEQARRSAKHSKIVVTNHSLLAHALTMDSDEVVGSANDSPNGGVGIYGAMDTIVIDEAHDFPDTFTSAVATSFTPNHVMGMVKKAGPLLGGKKGDAYARYVDPLETVLEGLDAAFHGEPRGEPLETLTSETESLLNAATLMLRELIGALQDVTSGVSAEDPKRMKMTLVLDDLLASYGMGLRIATPPEKTVRWVTVREDTQRATMNVAPYNIGDLFQESVEDQNVVLTSATLTLEGDFTPTLHAYGFDDSTRTLDVGSPFDYSKQGMLYIPSEPFPEPVGKDRWAHKSAVVDELVTLVGAAGGRTLALFTTRQSAVEAALVLRDAYPQLNILSHGEAPAGQLVEEFLLDETSVLCATMGLWQGVSPEGATCSLVVLDKLAFAPPDDVLLSARQQYVAEQGRNAFREVVLAQATTRVAQGVGRLIRTRSDRGVVAILDPRILSKGYGRTVLASLPPFGLYTEQNVVTDALTRLTGGLASAGARKPVVKRKTAGAARPASSDTKRRAKVPRKKASPTGKRIPQRRKAS